MPPDQKIIVIGASTGGIAALKVLAAGLAPNLPAPILVVQHSGVSSPGMLDRILSEAGPLRAHYARPGQLAESANIYLARPDHHLLIGRDGQMLVTRGPKENRFRPAIDPLFRSAAVAFGPRAIGAVLTGRLDDGTAGLRAIRECGGVTMVQNPEEAEVPSMPLNALKHVEVHHVVRLAEAGQLLTRLAAQPVAGGNAFIPSKSLETEVQIAQQKNALDSGIMEWGELSAYACPECHGVLLQRKEGSHVRFRCHVGHAYSIDSLLADCTERTEDALWNAVRAMEETQMLLDRMAVRIEQERPADAAELRRKAEDWKRRIELVRRAVMETPERAKESQATGS